MLIFNRAPILRHGEGEIAILDSASGVPTLAPCPPIGPPPHNHTTPQFFRRLAAGQILRLPSAEHMEKEKKRKRNRLKNVFAGIPFASILYAGGERSSPPAYNIEVKGIPAPKATELESVFSLSVSCGRPVFG